MLAEPMLDPKTAAREAAILPGGFEICVRAASLEDGDLLRAMFSRLSAQTVYRRFHAPYPRVPGWALGLFLNVDHRYRESLVAVVEGEVVGHAMYARSSGGRGEAEIGIVIEDAWQSKGIGKLLLSRLAAEAQRRGVAAFTGEVLGENRRALGFFSDAFPAPRLTASGGAYHIFAPLGSPRPTLGLAREGG